MNIVYDYRSYISVLYNNSFENIMKQQIEIVNNLFKKYFTKDELLINKENRYEINYKFLTLLYDIRSDFFLEIFHIFLEKICKYYAININNILSVNIYKFTNDLSYIFKMEDDCGFEKNLAELLRGCEAYEILKGYETRKELYYKYIEYRNLPFWYCYVYPFDHNASFLHELAENMRLLIIKCKDNNNYILVHVCDEKTEQYDIFRKYFVINKLDKKDKNIDELILEFQYYNDNLLELIGEYKNNYFTLVDNENLFMNKRDKVINITKEEYIEKYLNYNKAKVLIRKGL